MEVLKALEKRVKELYKIKLEKYKDKIDDLTLPQRAKLYRVLLEEAIIETGFERLSREYAAYQKDLQTGKGA